MAFRPLPDDDSSTIIWVNNRTEDHYIGALNTFLERTSVSSQRFRYQLTVHCNTERMVTFSLFLEYSAENQTENRLVDCGSPAALHNATGNSMNHQNISCRFDMKQLGPCTRNSSYGYKKRKPCVLLKINKVRSS